MAKSLHNRVNRTLLKEKLLADGIERTTLSFYTYARLDDPFSFRDRFYADLEALGVLGRVYIAREGINAQISVPSERVEALRTYLYQISALDRARLNFAIEDNNQSFFKLTIKVKAKIVADGLNDAEFDVTDRGRHINAEEFNRLAEDPDTVIVDMRNHYESEVGHFENAILPPMETFREGLPMVVDLLAAQKDKPVIMYCTGGIRCEKASAYLKYKGYRNVFQLDGGIIEYARQVAQQGLENKFKEKTSFLMNG